jgi:voltage-gated potassium channel
MPAQHKWKQRLYEVIFEADTPAGKAFDVALLWAILLSILLVMLESVKEIEQQYGLLFDVAEWAFTIIFTVEYVLRIVSSPKPKKYIFSFFGIIDFVAVIPTYLTYFIVGTHYLVVIRALRLLRIFRILKLNRYLGASKVISDALFASRAKILVFLFAVLNAVVIMGTIMYIVEGASSGFTSIPRSIYWAIVTITTVGYGEIAPSTIIGQILASIIMIMGYAVIAVPTGIVTSEMYRAKKGNELSCPDCGIGSHDEDANYCRICGTELKEV